MSFRVSGGVLGSLSGDYHWEDIGGKTSMSHLPVHISLQFQCSTAEESEGIGLDVF